MTEAEPLNHIQVMNLKMFSVFCSLDKIIVLVREKIAETIFNLSSSLSLSKIFVTKLKEVFWIHKSFNYLLFLSFVKFVSIRGFNFFC